MENTNETLSKTDNSALHKTNVIGSALQKHRNTWVGKSDEWLFNRLDKELKDKVVEIHNLLDRISELEKIICDCQDFDRGLVSNSCKIHNENPQLLDKDWQ